MKQARRLAEAATDAANAADDIRHQILEDAHEKALLAASEANLKIEAAKLLRRVPLLRRPSPPKAPPLPQYNYEVDGRERAHGKKLVERDDPPNGVHLILLARGSNAVLKAMMLMAEGPEMSLGASLLSLRRMLAETMAALDQIM